MGKKFFTSLEKYINNYDKFMRFTEQTIEISPALILGSGINVYVPIVS
jgi:hypothetical protein